MDGGRTVESVIRDLRAFGPDPGAADLCFRLYEVFEGFGSMSDRESAVPAMLDLLERCPDDDLGAPGPIVHELEAIPGYEPALVASLRRRPTYYTVWMVNRILNVERRPDVRAEWIALLQTVAANGSAHELARQQAQEYLALQEGR